MSFKDVLKGWYDDYSTDIIILSDEEEIVVRDFMTFVEYAKIRAIYESKNKENDE